MYVALDVLEERQDEKRCTKCASKCFPEMFINASRLPFSSSKQVRCIISTHMPFLRGASKTQCDNNKKTFPQSDKQGHCDIGPYCFTGALPCINQECVMEHKHNIPPAQGIERL